MIISTNFLHCDYVTILVGLVSIGNLNLIKLDKISIQLQYSIVLYNSH